MNLRRIMIGNPLATSALAHQGLSKLRALPIFSSDALSSVAYATEEILLVLATAGVTALTLSWPIALVICALLLIVTMSYRQTIHAYPKGGGAFIVSYDNLGKWSGLTAAAALMIDYILTVAVSVSAGIRAITSAFPELQPYALALCLSVVVLIAWINLRGIQESASVFSMPTYAFIAAILLMIGAGIWGVFNGSLTTPVITPTSSEATFQTAGTIGALVLLRAFASGCSAMTGVEAIANGVPAFRPPSPHNASLTLLIMAFILAAMFLGITCLADKFHIIPKAEESVLSQIAHVIFGNGIFYYVVQATTALILLLAANTSYAGFPRLASILAEKLFLPKQLSNLGDRLAFSNGILVLSALASVLLIIFNGNPHLLVPLYAVGVFLSFTLSQAGMVVRWKVLRSHGWLGKALVNGIGGIATATALVVLIESKFLEGAWMTLTLIPVLLIVFYKINRHYHLAEKDSPRYGGTGMWLRHSHSGSPKVVVPISKLHWGALAALNFARTLSPDVTVVIVNIDPHVTARLKLLWKATRFHEPLRILDSPYRSVITPILDYLRELDSFEPERGPAVVVLPRYVPRHWWQIFLHNQTALLLKNALTHDQKPGKWPRIIIDVPYRLKH